MWSHSGIVFAILHGYADIIPGEKFPGATSRTVMHRSVGNSIEHFNYYYARKYMYISLPIIINNYSTRATIHVHAHVQVYGYMCKSFCLGPKGPFQQSDLVRFLPP